MTEIERIIEQLQRSFNGRAWHGPPVIALLSDVNADQAVARPLELRHTIWELVLHMAAWKDKVWRVLQGEEMMSLPDEEDWPPIKDASEEAWKRAVDGLKRIHESLVEAMSSFDETKLNETVPGASYTFYNMFHGVIQHDLYHAGQIAILKKK